MKNDVFLSYAEEDRVLAAQIASALTAHGWSVWWDRQIPPGRTWRQTIEDAIAGMGCMVVLWSRHSIASPWVQEEAEEGLALVRLVPVLIDSVRPPMGFRSIQACDLRQREGEVSSAPGFRQLIVAIEGLVGVTSKQAASSGQDTAQPAMPAMPATGTGQEQATRATGQRGQLILLACAGVVAAGIAYFALLAPSSNTREAIAPPRSSPSPDARIDARSTDAIASPARSTTAPSATPAARATTPAPAPDETVAAATARPAMVPNRQAPGISQPRPAKLSAHCEAIRDRRDVGDPVSLSELKECRL